MKDLRMARRQPDTRSLALFEGLSQQQGRCCLQLLLMEHKVPQHPLGRQADHESLTDIKRTHIPDRYSHNYRISAGLSTARRSTGRRSQVLTSHSLGVLNSPIIMYGVSSSAMSFSLPTTLTRSSVPSTRTGTTSNQVMPLAPH